MIPSNNNETFYFRLKLGFVLLILSLLILSGLSLLALHFVVDAQETMTFNHAQDLINIQKLKISAEQKVSKSRAFLFTLQERFIIEMQESRDDFLQQHEELRAFLVRPRSKQLHEQVGLNEQAHQEQLEAAIKLARQGASRQELIAFWDDVVKPKRDQLDQRLDQFLGHKETLFEEAKLVALQAVHRANRLLNISAICAILLSIFLAFLVHRALHCLRDSENKLQTQAGELQEAIVMRDEFVSIASHELKTPLTSLQLQAQTMKRTMEKQGMSAFTEAYIQKMLDQTERQSRRLNRLVDDMLDLTRISSGKLQLQLQDVDLSEIVTEALERFKTELLEHNGGVQIHLHKNVIGHWDKFRLEQVITNLLTNAMKYGGGKPIQVSLTTKGNCARLCIQDQGMGIAEESRERIFKRFERAINSSEVSGLGLGLYISRQITEAHGGKLWVESEPGEGANFIMELPLA
jgi:signal transduction histidine kinase